MRRSVLYLNGWNAARHAVQLLKRLRATGNQNSFLDDSQHGILGAILTEK